MRLNVGRVYAVTSEHGCSVTFADGTPCATIPAGVGMFVAQAGEMLVSDASAEVRELPNGVEVLHGQMIKGQSGLPAGYKQVEYLESTGTQSLMDWDIPNESIVNARGEWVSQYTDTKERQFFGFSSASPYHGIDWGSNWCFKGSKADTFIHTFRLRVNDDEKKVYGNIDEAAETSQSVNSYKGLCGYCPFTISGSFKSALKCYSAKIWSDNKPVHDFIPCLDETGAPCMYDLVSRKSFYNAQKDDFLYPTETTTYSLRRVLPDWGKLTEHGLRRLYHAPANYTGELYDYAIENGYKPIVEPEQPEEGYWSPRWTETEDEIILEWVETEPPMDESLTNN